MKRLSIVSFSIFAIFLTSCSLDSHDPLEPDSNPVKEITYINDIKSIIDGSCISCHASTPINGAPMALVSRGQVKEFVVNRNLIDLVSDGSMPPGNEDLTVIQIQKIKDWEKNGFK